MYHTISNDVMGRAFAMPPYVWWDGAFNPEEMDQLVAYFTDNHTEKLQRGITFGDSDPEKVKDIRDSKVTFVHRDEPNSWIFNRMNQTIMEINQRFYGFDIYGYDTFQYTVYEGESQGKYDWHMDTAMGPLDPSARLIMRKITFVMLLSDDGDFTGGEFELNTGMARGETMKIETKKGRIIAFPSFMLHRVKPVLSGTRKSLVTWAEGPKFR